MIYELYMRNIYGKMKQMGNSIQFQPIPENIIELRFTMEQTFKNASQLNQRVLCLIKTEESDKNVLPFWGQQQ